MVHMYADQLLVYSFDRQGSNNGAVNTAGKCQQDLFAADSFANCSNLLFYKYLGKFGGGYANHVVRALIGIHAELFWIRLECVVISTTYISYLLIISSWEHFP